MTQPDNQTYVKLEKEIQAIYENAEYSRVLGNSIGRTELVKRLCKSLPAAQQAIQSLRQQLAEAQASIQNMRAALLCHGSAVDALNDRDWPEDFAHENGKYNCKCCGCGEYFVGYKRRVGCKVCVFKHMQATVDKLPWTADGVCPWVLMLEGPYWVYHPRYTRYSDGEPYKIRWEPYVMDGVWFVGSRPVSECYSTPEALQAALDKGEG